MSEEEVKQPAVETKPEPAQGSNPNGATGPKGIDWVEAKKYYCESFTKSYRDVSEKFDVALTNVEKKGSEEKWVEYRQKMGEKALEEFEQNKIMEIAHANKTHLEKYRVLLALATSKLKLMSVDKDVKPSDMKAVADTLEKAINGERLILGLPTTVSKSEIMGKIQTDLQLSPDDLSSMDDFFKNEK